MSLVVTEAGLLAQLGVVTRPGGFDPTTFSPTFYARGDVNLYKDAAMADPVGAWGDQIQQWKDFRQVSGGAAFPYLDWPTLGSRPTWAPELSPQGGVWLQDRHMDFSGMTGISTDDYTCIITGVLTPDYSRIWQGQGFLQAGTVFATGMMLGGGGFATDFRICPDLYYDGSLKILTSVGIPLGMGALILRSTGAGALVTADGVAAPIQAAAAHSVLSGGKLGEDARLAGNVSWAFVSSLFLKSPALSPADEATVAAGLLANGPLHSLYPSAWPLIIALGDSLTIATQSCPVLASQSYPAQLQASIAGGAGLLLAAKGGARADQITAAYLSGALAHVQAPSSSAKKFVSILAGTNDLGAGANTATILARLEALGGPLKAAGAVVNICTIYDNLGLTAPQQAERATLNTALRALFPTATAQTRVTAAAGGTTMGTYLTSLDQNPDLDDASDVLYFNDGTHNTPLGYTRVKTDVAGAAVLAAIA